MSNQETTPWASPESTPDASTQQSESTPSTASPTNRQLGLTRRDLLFFIGGAGLTTAAFSSLERQGTVFSRSITRSVTPERNREDWRQELVGRKDNLEARMRSLLDRRDEGLSRGAFGQVQRQWDQLCSEIQAYNASVEQYNDNYYVGSHPRFTPPFTGDNRSDWITPPARMEQIDLAQGQRAWNAPQVVSEGQLLPRTSAKKK